MSEFTKGELEIFFQDGKMYLECNTPTGKVRLAEMTMGHRTDSVADAEELVRRWNSHKDLLAACKVCRATFIGLQQGSIGYQAMQKVNAAIASAEA